jgi:hypothetical protein
MNITLSDCCLVYFFTSNSLFSDSDVRAICDVVLNHENIPRKKPKEIRTH